MSKQGISTGTQPNDGTGDTLLAATIKINNNFFYDTNRSNSTVIRVSDTSVTLDDNPPY